MSLPDSILDVHSHRIPVDGGAVVSLRPGDYAELCSGDQRRCGFSVGVHPWDTDCFAGMSRNEMWSSPVLAALRRDLNLPDVVAVGEAGIDRLLGASVEVQIEVFRYHIAISEEMGKPLIVHSVKAFDLIAALLKELRPVSPWIIHGFRGKPAQAAQLLRFGNVYLSFGEKFNYETVGSVPSGRILVETDESPVPVANIVAAIAVARGEDAAMCADIMRRNAAAVFGLNES